MVALSGRLLCSCCLFCFDKESQGLGQAGLRLELPAASLVLRLGLQVCPRDHFKSQEHKGFVSTLCAPAVVPPDPRVTAICPKTVLGLSTTAGSLPSVRTSTKLFGPSERPGGGCWDQGNRKEEMQLPTLRWSLQPHPTGDSPGTEGQFTSFPCMCWERFCSLKLHSASS